MRVLLNKIGLKLSIELCICLICKIDRSLPLTLSHKKVMFAGQCCNQKLSTTFLHLRFNKFLLTFDICKVSCIEMIEVKR